MSPQPPAPGAFSGEERMAVTPQSEPGLATAHLTKVAEEVHTDAIVVGASEHRLGSLAVRLVRDARWLITAVP